MNFNSEDLRSFLAEVESGYKLQRISQAVSVTNEIPALCSEITLPTVFENLQGFANWRLTDGLIRDRVHQAIALKCRPQEVIARYAQLTIPVRNARIVMFFRRIPGKISACIRLAANVRRWPW